MQRLLPILLLAVLPLWGFGQAQRIVLIEEFTNASCAPCGAQNPDFNVLLNQNGGLVVPIKYQTQFPGYDPFWEQNGTEINARADYYGLSGVPTAWIDGALPGNDYGGGVGEWNITANSGYAGGPYGYNQAVINYAAGLTTPLTIDLTHSLNETIDTITIDVKVKNISDTDFTPADGRLHVALLERFLEFPEAPGSNGEVEYEWIMRKMYPGVNGTSFTSIAAGDSLEMSMTVAVPGYIYRLDELQVAAFVQDHTSQEVWQAGITEVQEVPGGVDGGVTANLTAEPQELCGASIVPVVRFENAGEVPITNALIDLVINDATVATHTYEGNLMPGESEDITFEELVLTEANTFLSFEIVEVNEGAGIEVNRLNDVTATASYQALSEDPIGDELSETNEIYNLEYPTTAIAEPGIPLGDFGGNSFVVYSRNQLTTQTGDPIGGFGESARSIFVNFYQWNPSEPNAGNDGTLTYQKVDLGSYTNAALTFDIAGAGYQGSTDRMQVLVSTDCAETFTIVWDAQGSELYTAPDQNPFYVPNGGDWETVFIDLADFIGQEVNIQFKAISAWGNNVYLDNINVSGTTSTREPGALLNGALEVFPNPVNDRLRTDFELTEPAYLQVGVYNAFGQLVQAVEARNFNAGSHQLQVDASRLSAGMYFLRMQSADGEVTRRFVVSR